MEEITKVCFGIQARSTSSRFPGKILKEIEPGKSMLRVVIDNVDSSAFYLNRRADRTRVNATVAVLVPKGDPAVKIAQQRSIVIEGSEYDVLSRYYELAERMDSDYVVRITADCPMVPPWLMSDHILIAVKRGYDYCSNVFEAVRTALDGHDVEVISRAAIKWAHENATEPSDREHVTTILRSAKRPAWMKVGCVMHRVDESHIKKSVDTPEELERAKDELRRLKEKMILAEHMFGKDHVHKI